MEAHKSPSVFNFYQPEYQPAGPVARANLVAPEAGLATAPYLIGFLNGMLSLIDNGLSSCLGGFGRQCSHWKLRRDYPDVEWSDGQVTFAPAQSSAAEVVSELDLLLTGGRLNVNATAVITSRYEEELASSGDAQSALQLAQQLMVAAPEFHATNLNPPAEAPRPSSGKGSAGGAGNFKAIVVMYFGGGADSYNILVPHSNCAAKDMFAHYETWRGDVKLPKSSLREINVTGTSPPQPCATFAVHSALDDFGVAGDRVGGPLGRLLRRQRIEDAAEHAL